jgi:hypothetical protein
MLEGVGDQRHARLLNTRGRGPLPTVQEAGSASGPALKIEALCTFGQLLPAYNLHVAITQEMIILTCKTSKSAVHLCSTEYTGSVGSK